MSSKENERRFARNLGFISVDEQRKLADARVGIAGCGGDGGQAAEALARMGVGAFVLADPEIFELENINRQCAAEDGIGENKAEVIARRIAKINPLAKIRVYTEGITIANITKFVDASDIIVDESDFTVPHIGIALAREARRQHKVVVMGLNLGFGGLVTSFVPGRMTLERRLGYSTTSAISEIEADSKTSDLQPWRWIPALPGYTDLGALARVVRGEISVPSVVQGVLQCAAMTSTEVYKHLTGGKGVHVAPVYQWIDPKQGTQRRVRASRISFYSTLLRIAARRSLGRRKVS